MVRRFALLVAAATGVDEEGYCGNVTVNSVECCCAFCPGEGTGTTRFAPKGRDGCLEMGGQCKFPQVSAYNRGPTSPRAPQIEAKVGQEPEQVHLIAGAPDELTVVYATAEAAATFVELREVGTEEISRFEGASSTYSAQQIATRVWDDDQLPNPSAEVIRCDTATYTDPNCVYSSPYIHTVRIEGLKPGTLYEHRPNGRSDWRSFKTAPAVGEPIAFSVLADLGTTLDSVKTMRHIAEELNEGRVDSAIYPGDLSYADGFGDRWDDYARQGEFLWERLPTAYTVGNHEYQKEQFIHYLARYPAPGKAQEDQNRNYYYSYDAGMAHVIMLCSYCETRFGSPQYKWLERDLAKVDRAKTPWLLVSTHVPWYTSNARHPMAEYERMRTSMEDLLYRHQADVFLGGHLHSYERTFSVYRNETACDGMVYITIGDGGNHEGPACPWVQHGMPEWEAKREYSFGSGVLDIVNGTHAQWRWHRNHDGAKVIADSVWLHPASMAKGGGHPACSAAAPVVV